MIGKPKWFTRRKYGGWGICPKSWQGWAYIMVFLIPFAIFQSLPFWSIEVRVIATAIWLIIIAADTIDISLKMKKDERDKVHEAIAERNALWIMIPLLAVGFAYKMAASAVTGRIEIDYWIAAALILGLAAKAITNIYLDRKD